jgi:hypothetical protein
MKKYTLHILYVSLFAVFIFGFTYLPFQDFPILAYQGFVFNEFVFHGNTFGGFFHFQPYIPPNAVSTVIMGIMDVFFDAFVAGKIYLFLLAVALYSGIYRYLRFHLETDSVAFASVAFFLTINVHFLMSYINFLTGLALVFHAIVFIRQRHYETNILALGIVILAIYLCHFMPLVLFGLYFTSYFIVTKNYRAFFRLFVAAIPTIIIFIQYLLTRTIPILQDDGIIKIIDIIHWKFLILFSPLIPFNVFKWVQEIQIPFRITDYIYSVILLICMLYVMGKSIIMRRYSFELWLAIVTFGIAVFIPLNFGGVIPAGERFVSFCVVNIVIISYREKMSRTRRRVAFTLCFLLGIAAYSYDLWNEVLFNTMVLHNEIPQEAITHSSDKLQGTNGFLHLHFYDDIRQKRAIPSFNIGLFGYPGSNKN